MEKRLQQLNQLQHKIRSYGKENLQEILHFVTDGMELITGLAALVASTWRI